MQGNSLFRYLLLLFVSVSSAVIFGVGTAEAKYMDDVPSNCNDTASYINNNVSINERKALCRSGQNFGQRYTMKKICTCGTSCGHCGSAWISSPGTAYGDARIAKMNWDKSSIKLEFRGAVVRMGNVAPEHVGAREVSIGVKSVLPKRVVAKVSPSVSDGFLYRGGKTNERLKWYYGSKLPFTLKVSNLKPGETAKVTLKFYRCYCSCQGSGRCTKSKCKKSTAPKACATEEKVIKITKEKRPLDYDLTPTISTGDDYLTVGADSVNKILAKVKNGGPTKSKKANYATVRFIVRNNPDANLPKGSKVTVPRDPNNSKNLISDWPCYVVHGTDPYGRTGLNENSIAGRNRNLNIDARSCISGGGLRKGSVKTIASKSSYTVVDNKSNDISSLDLGPNDSLCYTTIVSTYNQSIKTDTFRYAKPKCLKLAKKPKVQFWGGDIRTGKDVVTSISRKDPFSYGSWAEYGALVTGNAISASGAGLSSGPAGRKVSNEASYNRLTFANTTTPYGNYGNVPRSTVPQAFLEPGKTVGSKVDLSNLNSGTYSRSGNLRITGGYLDSGRQIIIRATGTVTIAGNLYYSGGGYTNLSSLPQLVIIARNIIINSNVTEVNAWLIAQSSKVGDSSGYISTCRAVDNDKDWLAGVTASNCNKQLQINGPVIANHLYLKRTFGAEKDNLGLPAEVINLRPDAYLWALERSRHSGAIKTTYLRELPPRF